MNEKITNFGQLRAALHRAKALIGQVASATSDAVSELDEQKQNKLTGTPGQIAGFDATGSLGIVSGVRLTYNTATNTLTIDGGT